MASNVTCMVVKGELFFIFRELSREFRAALMWWRFFVQPWNGVGYFWKGGTWGGAQSKSQQMHLDPGAVGHGMEPSGFRTNGTTEQWTLIHHSKSLSQW